MSDVLVAAPPEETTTTVGVPGTWTYGADPARDALIVGIPLIVLLLAILVTYTVAK